MTGAIMPLPSTLIGQLSLALILGLATLAIVLDTRLHVAVYAPLLDVVVASSAAVIALAVALLGATRWRETGDVTALFDASALLLIATANAAHVLLLASSIDVATGLEPGAPRATPIYAWAMVRDVALALLLATMVPRVRRWQPSRRAASLVVVAPVLAVLALTLALGLAEAAGMFGGAEMPTLANPDDRRAFFAPTLVDLLNIAGLGAIAIAALVRPRHPGGALPVTWLAGALTLAAFAQLHVVLFPTAYVGLLTTADVLQVAFYVALFAGLHVSGVRNFQLAQQTMARDHLFHQSDVAEAVQAERMHLARELHDGVAQDLVALRLELDEAARDPRSLGPSRAMIDRASRITADAIFETRRTIDVLRSGEQPLGALSDLLPRRLREFAEEHGFELELRTDPVIALVLGRRAAEVMRIVDEALANIRRHADATVVRVTTSRAGASLILTVVDNGRGFCPERASPGHGLTGMRERAALLGGDVKVTAARGEGTHVRLFAPLRGD